MHTSRSTLVRVVSLVIAALVATALTTGTPAVAAPGDHPISINVVDPAAVPIQGAFLVGCRNPFVGTCDGQVVAVSNVNGDATLNLDSDFSYSVVAVLGADVTAHQTVDAGFAPASLDFTIFPTRAMTFNVLDADGAPLPPSVVPRAVACPTPAPVNPACPGLRFAVPNAAGTVTIRVDADKEYTLLGYAFEGTVFAPPVILAPGVTAATETFLLPRRVSGTVSRSGFTTFPPNSAGVGACPAPDLTFPCPGLQFVLVNADGTYSLNLTAGQWGIAGFAVVGNQPLIGPGQLITVRAAEDLQLDFSADVDGVTPAVEDGAPNGGDGNSDGIPDADQEHVTSLPSATGPYLTIETPIGSSLVSVGTAAIGNPPPPVGVTLPYGLVSFTVGGITPGSSVPITIILPSASSNAEYWKLQAQTWTTVPATSVGNEVTIVLTDGGLGDQDGTANGFIVDPGGVAYRLAFGGWSAPVSGTSTNVVKAGSAVPLKFAVTAGGQAAPDGANITSLAAAPCAGGAATAIDGLTGQGGGRFHASWKTAKADAGSCVVVTLTLIDGSTHTATFSVR